MTDKCPKCLNTLTYIKEKNKFVCEKCNSEFDNITLNTYICSSCGSSITSNLSINNCIYCKNSTIDKNNSMRFSAEYILPFNVTRMDAIKEFKRITKNKFLKPKYFKESNFNDIVGIYVPYLLCDYDVIGEVEATCDIVSKWKSDGYKYTKTDKYSATRGGKMTLKNIPICCSKCFKDDIFKSIEPFDYTDLKRFDSSYLVNYLQENIEISKDELVRSADKKARDLFKDEIKKDIKGYSEITFTKDSINLNNLRSVCVLLPVWLLNIKYKNNIYTFAMNGQTAKLTGFIPKSLFKIIILFICSFLLTFIVLFILNYLKVRI